MGGPRRMHDAASSRRNEGGRGILDHSPSLVFAFFAGAFFFAGPLPALAASSSSAVSIVTVSGDTSFGSVAFTLP